MTSENKTQVVTNLKEKFILVSRTFKAPLHLVWRAHTEADLLDQWWGPSPWRAETKTMNFKPGAFWLYAMVGPQGEKHWGRTNYIAIEDLKRIEFEDVFCDENGTVNPELPVSKGLMLFTETHNGTLVEFKTTYANEKDVQTIVEMGFEQGITICQNQLVEVLVKIK